MTYLPHRLMDAMAPPGRSGCVFVMETHLEKARVAGVPATPTHNINTKPTPVCLLRSGGTKTNPLLRPAPQKRSVFRSPKLDSAEFRQVLIRVRLDMTHLV